MNNNNNDIMSFLNNPEFIDKPKLEKENNLRKANKHIADAVTKLYQTHRMLSAKFYFIHINYYCFIENRGYVPCEIAVSEFSIDDGVTRIWHKFINPGEIPVGYSSLIMDHREETHKLTWPLPPDIQAVNLQDIYDQLVSFIAKDEQYKNIWQSDMPPLFTVNYNGKFVNLADNERIVSDVLDSLCSKSRSEVKFMVYPAVKLYQELQNSCAVFALRDIDEEFSESQSEKEMEKDVFQHRQNLACEYHISLDAVEHCSKSFVLRWSYTVLRDCCDTLGVTKVINRHMPPAMQTVISEQITDVYFDGRRQQGRCVNCKGPLEKKPAQSTKTYRNYSEFENKNANKKPQNNSACEGVRSPENNKNFKEPLDNKKVCSDSTELKSSNNIREYPTGLEGNKNVSVSKDNNAVFQWEKYITKSSVALPRKDEVQNYSKESLTLPESKPSAVRKPNPETLREAIRTCRSTMSLLIKSNAVEPEYFVPYTNKGGKEFKAHH